MDHQQIVALSCPKHISLGVPQVSKLSPILFVIYLNDIAYNLYYCNVILFAADTAYYLIDSEQLSLIKAKNWIAANKLKLSESNIQFSKFSRCYY